MLVSLGFAIVTVFLSPKVIPILFLKYADAVEIVQIMVISIIPITINLMYNAKFLGIEKSRPVLYGSVIFIMVQITLIVILGEMRGIMA